MIKIEEEKHFFNLLHGRKCGISCTILYLIILTLVKPVQYPVFNRGQILHRIPVRGHSMRMGKEVNASGNISITKCTVRHY